MSSDGGLSDVFLRQRKRRLRAWYRKISILLLVTGLPSAGAIYFYLEGGLNAWVASIPIALHIYVLVSTVFGALDIRRIRIIPYFEKPVGGAETFASGKVIANHLRDLDEKAAALGVATLSSFASGDDLVEGEELQWHSPYEALRTVDELLSQPTPNAIRDELVRLKKALALTASHGTKFCLLLREGSSTSGWEMNIRQGGFF